VRAILTTEMPSTTSSSGNGGAYPAGTNVPARYGARGARNYVVEYMLRERFFLIFVGIAFLASGMFYQTPSVARWLGFLFAGYAVVGNDSIQTIGTFIASNEKKPWWAMWLFIGGLFVATVGYSYLQFGGDVTHQRLTTKGFSETPTSFSFLQVAAPLFLLILTRLRMPVSTTFLLLTSFATTPAGVGMVLQKSLLGYVVAFVASMVVWGLGAPALQKWYRTPAHPAWRLAQWLTSGALWSVWVMQDAANIAIYLPRQLSVLGFVAFAGTIFVGLGMLFHMRGERIQGVVNEKSDVVDVRAATVIDFVYACILYYFQSRSKIPMSTTWVFIGLLGGRELAMSLRGCAAGGWRVASRILLKDVLFAGIGLLVSLLIAAAVNEGFREGLW